MSEKLIEVFEEKIRGVEVNAVNARELHEHLESHQEFGHWIKNKLLENKFFKEGRDYVLRDAASVPISWGGHNKKDYFVTFDAAKIITCLENTTTGRKCARFLINHDTQQRKKLQNKFKQALIMKKTTNFTILERAQQLYYHILEENIHTARVKAETDYYYHHMKSKRPPQRVRKVNGDIIREPVFSKKNLDILDNVIYKYGVPVENLPLEQRKLIDYDMD